MPEYSFHGRKLNGETIQGRRNAQSAESLAGVLSDEGIIPINISVYHDSLSSLDVLKGLWQRRLPIEDLQMFTRQMHALNKAGVPIITSVTRLAETARSPHFSRALLDIVKQLNSGQDLASSLQHFPNYFSPLFVSIVRIGENSGRLDIAFLQLSEHYNLEEMTVRRLKTALRYPTFVIIAIVSAMLLINVLVIPAFAQMFASFKEQLPLPTKIIIGFSNFLTSYWPLLLLASIVIGIAIYVFIKNPRGQMWWGRVQLKLPVMGWIIKRILLARFCRTFSLMLHTGIPMGESIRLVAKAMANDFVSDKVNSMHDSVARGESLSSAAVGTHLFSPLVIQMLQLGEETGELDEMLVQVSEYYEREVDYDLSRLSDAIEPILLIGLGAMVLVLALGVFLPMWDMVKIARMGH